MPDWEPLNAAVIEEFRQNGGRVAQFGDLPVVVLHTIRARTKAVREIPLIVVPDDERMFLFATAAGAPEDPGWVADLREQPRIDVELGAERFEAEVGELDVPAAEIRVGIQAERSKQFAAYLESAAPRRIPVFEISRR